MKALLMIMFRINRNSKRYRDTKTLKHLHRKTPINFRPLGLIKIHGRGMKRVLCQARTVVLICLSDMVTGEMLGRGEEWGGR